MYFWRCLIMLSSISQQICMPTEAPRLVNEENKWARNEKDDMKKAIELLYDFKKSLGDLHPNCLNLIENMLQHPRRY